MKSQPTVGVTVLRQVGLICVRKVDEQAGGASQFMLFKFQS